MSDEADNVISDLDYRIFAKNIRLTSAVSPPDLGATELFISSMGAGAPLNNGSVFVEANQSIDLNCGNAHVRLSDSPTKSGLSLGCDGNGNTEIWQGSTPGSANLRLTGPTSAAAEMSVGLIGVGSYLAMSPKNLTLANGPPVVGAAMAMSADGLKLTFAAGSIEMSAAGIDLAVGTNKISLGIKGISINGMMIDMAAMTKFTMQGLQIEESASAQFTTAPSTIKML